MYLNIPVFHGKAGKMLAAIIIFASLVAIIVGIVAYRSWFLQHVEQLTLELTHLNEEMERGEQETIGRRDEQQKLNTAVAAFNYADLTAKKAEELLKQKCDIPVPALPAPDAQGKVVMEQLGSLLQTLNTHSIEVAGVEQVLLNTLPVPGSEVYGQITLAYFSGLFPPGLHQNAGSIVQQLAQGHLDNIASLGSVATDLVNNLIRLYETNPFEIVSLAEHLAPGEDILAHFLDPAHLQVYLSTLSSLSTHLVPDHQAALHAASHLQHVQHLQHAGVGIDHLGHVSGFDAHFPFITAAISVSREIALLKESKTSVGTSFKNASLDVLGTGTGGAVGGAIGTFLIPVPVLGTIVGSVAGGMFGRFLSNRVKEKPFKEAKEQLEVAVNTLEKEETVAAHQALRHVHLAASEKKLLLINQMQAMPKLDEWERRQLIADASDLYGKAEVFLQQARMLINSAKKYAGDQSSSTQGIANLSKQLVQVEGKVRRAESMLPSETLIQSKPLDVLESLSYMPVPLPTYTGRIKEATDNAVQTTTKYRKEMMTWSCQIMETYLPLANALTPVIESEGQKYKRTCDGYIAKVNEASARVQIEAQALGFA